MVLGMITGLRRPAHWAAVAGAVLAAVLIWWLPDFTLPGDVLTSGAGGAGLLVLNAAAVMLPGVYLSQVLTRREVHRSLREWVRGLPLPGPAKIALVVAGIAPTVEALTGFGVSLLVTVPVLLALAPPPTALRQAMLGMNIMPWGTLGLATVIGAALTGKEVAVLGTATAVTSSLVFPLVTTWAALLARPRRRFRTAAVAAAAGAALSLGLLALNLAGVVQPAGVLAGLLTTGIGLAFCAVRGPATARSPPAGCFHRVRSCRRTASSWRYRPHPGGDGRRSPLPDTARGQPGSPAVLAGAALWPPPSAGPRPPARPGRPSALARRSATLALTGSSPSQAHADSGMIAELGAAVAGAPSLVTALAAPRSAC
ncbi:hypothetical protein BLA24_06300 [Streptomyces cinnamoneus]|uniref:L-lactate permease n=2 Tax=Streptomyces cinnamoneus TaxID=53446 RepID=A0A2G1XN16_STRCJ|nr:hypothetical protein BLA24_06300 [Streptomyces cinnamoneus]